MAVFNSETRPSICSGDFIIYQSTRCVRRSAEPGCSHIIFPLMNMSYSHICGTVESSWFGIPDGFIGNDRSPTTAINENYVNGISLTYGKESSRTHIWTFIALAVLITYQTMLEITIHVSNGKIHVHQVPNHALPHSSGNLNNLLQKI